MHRDGTDKIAGGVLSGIAKSLGLSPALLRGLFIVALFGIGGITLGVSAGGMVIIYLLFWMFTPER